MCSIVLDFISTNGVQDSRSEIHATSPDRILSTSTLIYDDGTSEPAEMTPNTHHINRADRDLRRWLVVQARTGVPELVLVALLRSYAFRIERRGHVPRGWDDPDCAQHLEVRDDH